MTEAGYTHVIDVLPGFNALISHAQDVPHSNATHRHTSTLSESTKTTLPNASKH